MRSWRLRRCAFPVLLEPACAASEWTLGVARGYLHRLINQLEIRGKEETLLQYPVEKPGRPQLVA